MKIDIQGRDVEIDSKLRHFVQHRVDFALRRRADHIGSVVVHLSDADGAETSCLVQVRLHGLDDVCVEHRDASPYVAIHRAADHAGWTVARSILRQHRKLIAALIEEPLTAGRREPEWAA